MISRSAVAETLKQAAISWLIRTRNSVHLELGLNPNGKLRADLLAIDFKRILTVVEVKSCLEDFKTDKKWRSYTQFCHKLYFCFDQATYEDNKQYILENVDKNGILVLDNATGYCKVVKRCQDVRTVSDSHMNFILLKMAWRSGINVSNRKRRRFWIM